MAKTEDVGTLPVTQLAIRLQQVLNARGLTIRSFSEEMDMTYEYLRRLLNGTNLPSKNLLKLFCQKFGWDYEEMSELLVQDSFRKRFGEKGAVAQQVNPEVQPFQLGWDLLERAQKDILLAQFNMFIAQNRRHARSGVEKEGQ